MPSLELASLIHERVKLKLSREAVEDFRIDFEDGFGVRSDAEEDETAVATAKELAAAWADGIMSPFSGIRIKSFGAETCARSLRTLDLFLTELTSATRGKIDENFVVTLPKITHHHHVEILVRALQALEDRHELPARTFKFEIMVETAQTVIGPEGIATLPKMIQVSDDRCVAAHFGTYDYTANMDITANYQSMDHPACDFARHVMKVTLAGTGVRISDGATNIMPVPVHKDPNDDAQKAANLDSVYGSWRLSYAHIRHSLKHGIYQGWDLHPGQVPIRYVALYAFFLEGLVPAQTRLKNFIEHAAKATLAGDVFDDAATGQGLLNYFLRAQSCGAIEQKDIEATGLKDTEIAKRSFMRIIRDRQNA